MDLHNYKPDFSLLPSHIITCILRYLDIPDFKNASIVCKSWFYSSTDPQIEKTLIIEPTNANVTEIQKSNRRYGVLRLRGLSFDKEDSHFEFLEKVCPYIIRLSINNVSLSIHQLLKLLELSTSLKVFHLEGGQIQCPGLFPVDYIYEAKVIKNIYGINNITIKQFGNIPLIKDLLKCATNLNTFKFANLILPFIGYEYIFPIFDYVGNVKKLQLCLRINSSADAFIKCFAKIKNLNLKWFKIIMWSWRFELYESSIFQQFIMKLESVQTLILCVKLIHDQLSIICQYLVNLKDLDCMLDEDQKISELGNLQQLTSLHCRVPLNINIVEINNLFKCRFQNLQRFYFNGFVTESSLVQFCKNHPNLIELTLNNLLTRKLQIIYKYLIKLQVGWICYGFSRLNLVPVEKRYTVHDVSPIDLTMESEYNKYFTSSKFEMFSFERRLNSTNGLQQLHLTYC